MGSGSLIKFGTSSFSSKDWIGPFYPNGTPPGEFIRFYSEQFDTVEVDSTYYRIPSKQIVESWIRKTPDDFIFAAKFPRSIVHAGNGPKPDTNAILIPEKTYVERDKFLEVISHLGNRLGPLILQFPYFSKKDFEKLEPFMERLDRFLDDLPKQYKYGVEIRNRNWLNESFADLCRKHDVAMVLVDQAWMPHGDEIAERFDPITTDFSYIRLLGDRKEIESFTKKWDREVIDRKERLQRWSKLLANLDHSGVRTYVYVNNHYAGHGPATLRRLREMFELDSR